MLHNLSSLLGLWCVCVCVRVSAAHVPLHPHQPPALPATLGLVILGPSPGSPRPSQSRYQGAGPEFLPHSPVPPLRFSLHSSRTSSACGERTVLPASSPILLDHLSQAPSCSTGRHKPENAGWMGAGTRGRGQSQEGIEVAASDQGVGCWAGEQKEAIGVDVVMPGACGYRRILPIFRKFWPKS